MAISRRFSWRSIWFLCITFLQPLAVLAEEAAPLKIDTGDTSWVLVSTALVLLMTPGLAFFYSGMVQSKNVVSTLYQNYIVMGVVGLLWAICGYSLAFSGDSGGLIGDLGYFLLEGVGADPNPTFAATIPHALFMLFQCMFAVITPALITGAIAERINFKAWLLFSVLWSLCVYSPIAHWVWGVGGWIRNLGGIDFAGGMVVHMSSGYSALVAAIYLGKRKTHGKVKTRPHDAGMILLGTALLWFGWFGFNAGSSLGANGIAVQAFGTTFFAAAAALVSWTAFDIITKGKPSAIGASCGAVTGLVCITPAAGFVSFGSAIVMGLMAGVICNLSVTVIKGTFKNLDDTLDVFACHGVGGTLGTVLTAVFASKAINPAGADGLLYGSGQLVKAHFIGSLGIIVVSIVATVLLLKIVNLVTPLRVSEGEETSGLDISQHDEVISSFLEEKGAST